MRSIRKTAGLAAILLIVLLIGTYAVLGWIVQQQRQTAIAAWDKPESIKAHEAIEKARESTVTHAATATPPDGNLSAQSPPSPSDAPMPKNRIAQFASCCSTLDALKADSAWNQKWDTMCLDWRSQSQDQWTEAQWRQLGEVLAKAEPLLAQIRVLFVQEGPIWPLETDSTFESGRKRWAALREFTRLFWFSTLFQAHTGAHDAAFDDVLAAFQTGDLLANEPMMFSLLTRFACHDMARNALLQTFAPGVLTAGQLDRLASYAATPPNRNTFAEALKVEAYQTAQSTDDPSHVHGSVFLYNMPGIEGLFWRVYSTPLAKPLYNRDEFAFAAFLQEMAAASRQPFYEAYRQLSTSYERLDETWFIPLARVSANGMLSVLDAQAKNEANLSLMAIGLRLEQ